MTGEPINLAEAFTHIALCAPGWIDQTEEVLAETIDGPMMVRIVEHPSCPPGIIKVLPPRLPEPWMVLA